jgi:hypothetical protein
MEKEELMSRGSRLPWVAAMVLSAGLGIVPLAAAAGTETLTGKISDTMCGAEHREGTPPADCVRSCVKHGAKYALVVGDKVYTLNTSDKAMLAELNKMAWENAKVTGTVEGDTVALKSVTAADTK